MCLNTGAGWVVGLKLTVPRGSGFDLEIIAGNGSVLLLHFAGAGGCGFVKLEPIQHFQLFPLSPIYRPSPGWSFILTMQSQGSEHQRESESAGRTNCATIPLLTYIQCAEVKFLFSLVNS